MANTISAQTAPPTTAEYEAEFDLLKAEPKIICDEMQSLLVSIRAKL